MLSSIVIIKSRLAIWKIYENMTFILSGLLFRLLNQQKHYGSYNGYRLTCIQADVLFTVQQGSMLGPLLFILMIFRRYPASISMGIIFDQDGLYMGP